MKFLIAPDSFKESLSAEKVAEAIKEGFAASLPDAQYSILPMADGGEGTCDALVSATDGKKIDYDVTGPLGETVTASIGVLGGGKTAIIEMASAAGLDLVPADQRDPAITTTFGVGELISKALDLEIKHIVVGLGGSATNDAGAGMLQALGVSLKGQKGAELERGGLALTQLEQIDISGLDPRLADCHIELACDVNNPLTGSKGASWIFGAQKGADPHLQVRLDDALKHFADLVRAQLDKEIDHIEGAGAAGGLGAALIGFMSAEVRRGVDLVLSLNRFDQLCRDAIWVITGEGRIDGQSIFGKTPVGVAEHAKMYGCKVIAIAGSLGEGYEKVYSHGIDAVFSVVPGVCELQDALDNAEDNIRQTARNIGATMRLAN